MNTKLLMMASAIVLVICGASLQFFPHELLNYFQTDSGGIAPLLAQMTGALFLGFAMMNWMAKTVLIGGIYARPLAIGNFVHFLVGALALVKYAFAAPATPIPVWTLVALYTLFAALFGYVFFTHPLKANVASTS